MRRDKRFNFSAQRLVINTGLSQEGGPLAWLALKGSVEEVIY
ncbi:MAG: hypothetical protein WKF74_07580 [Pyrinomonadaceae bacterium]